MSISSSTIRKIIALGLSKKATNSVLEILACEQEVEEIRLKKQRDRTARCRARNVTVTLPSQLQKQGVSYVEEMDVKTMDVKEKEELPVKQEMLNQVPVKAGAREAEFEVFYQAYPHKVGRPAAAKSFTKANKKAPLEQILAGLETYIGSKPPDRPWCNPATWLNQERWNDHPAPVQPPAKPLSPRLSVIMNNRRMFSEAAAAEITELRSLGGPTPEIIPTDRSPRYG